MRKTEIRSRGGTSCGEPPGPPRPPPLVRFADKALRAFPEGVRFAAAALIWRAPPR